MKKQFLLLAAGVVLVLIFFFGFSNKPPKKSVYAELSEKLIDSLDLNSEAEIVSLTKDLSHVSDAGKITTLDALARAWYAAGYPTIGADYLRQLADLQPSFDNYMMAGKGLFESLQMDTTQQMRMNLVYGARYCFENALALEPENTDAKISLANVLVQGTSQPMEGIKILREIEASDPGNVKVNQALGEFSLMSGQYDKAIERFSVVLQKDSLNLRSRYLLAEAYLGLQDTANAIGVLEETILMVDDSVIVSNIRRDITNLKNH